MNETSDCSVFVGIPTWNRPDFVKDAINSVRAQTFTNFRCIVSDNHSDPGTVQQVKAYVESLNDPRFSFHQQPENCGENGQCHWFLEQCQEDLFIFLHDDDKLEPQLIDAANDVMKNNPDVDFYSSSLYLFDENGYRLTEETKAYNTDLLRDELADGIVENALVLELQRGVFALSGTVFRTLSLRECGLDDGLDTYPFDFNVMLRQVERDKNPWWDSRQLMGYRWHSGQERKKTFWDFDEHHILGFQKIIKGRTYSGTAEKLRRRLLAFSYRRHAYMLYAKGKWREGHKLLRKNVYHDPSNIRAWIYFVFATFFPPLIKPIWGKKMTFMKRA